MSDSQVKLRMPTSMREYFRRQAEANRRSMNAEIVHYLDRALATKEASGAAVAADQHLITSPR